MHGASVTLHSITFGSPDSDYGDRAVTDTTSTITAVIAPWASLRLRMRPDERGRWADEDMVALVKSGVSVTAQQDYIDDGSEKWDIIDLFSVKLYGDEELQLLQLRLRKI